MIEPEIVTFRVKISLVARRTLLILDSRMLLIL